MDGADGFYVSTAVGVVIGIFMLTFCARELIRLCGGNRGIVVHPPLPPPLPPQQQLLLMTNTPSQTQSPVQPTQVPSPRPTPPLIVLELVTDDNECPICLEDIETNTKPNRRMVRIALCGHIFCHPCLTTWLAIHRTCPLCNQKL